MKSYLTKSLFVEFTSSPKLARWHANNRSVYKEIQKSMYGDMDGLTIGQIVEDKVIESYQGEVSTINTENMWENRHQTYHERTVIVLEKSPDIIYQPSFLLDDVFVKCDLLVKNDEGKYDLVEVKAKNNIRKKTKAEPLLDELVADLSVQCWVLQRALGDSFSGKCIIAYLDKEYKKQGKINPNLLIKKEEVTEELMTDALVEIVLKAMRESLVLSEEQFNARYPYDGKDYITYFGEPAPKSSLRSISGLRPAKKLELYEQGKINLNDFDAEDINYLMSEKGESTKASRFVELRQRGEGTKDDKAIQEELQKLNYPLYFYDYETVSWPVPLLEGTSPWQQVVVQYSIHKVEQDGTITHNEAILQPGEETNECILKQMIQDMDSVENGTYIVRYKGFENTRNKELGGMYPDYKEALERINLWTFDLMEIFSKQLYFHRDFEGSASIKKVLPVLTDISYEGLPVPNGAVASNLLMQTLDGRLIGDELVQAQKNLLEYCKQDTWAMVEIWNKLQGY